MNNYLAENLKVLYDRFPQLAAKFETNRSSLENQKSAFKFFKSQKGSITASFISEGQENAFLSKMDPEKNAKLFTEKVFDPNFNIHLLFGLELGYTPSFFLEKMKEEDKLIVVEPNWDLFLGQMKAIDFTMLFRGPRFTLIVSSDYEEVMDFLRIHFWKMKIRDFSITLLPIYKTLFGKYFLDLKKQILSEKVKIESEEQFFKEKSHLIKKEFFVDGQMRGVDTFFERIENAQKKRELNDVELHFLLIRNFLKYRPYSEVLNRV